MTVVSAIISLQYTKKHGKSPTGIQFKVLDLVAVLAYIGVLIPIWAVEIRKLRLSGFGLLVGYTTAPMIVNMAIHMYFTMDGLPWNRIFSAIYSLRISCQQCPNCQQKFLASASTTQTTTKKGYSLLRGEDYLDIEADPIQYRDSEDFLGEGAEHAEYARLPEQANEPEDTDKGKVIIEV
ncbi:hypothetical protein N0V94_006132 [Neodidymelliopsis sp. IMI 364377]|nr:hypothetical protein N0V94_006132 [Neodidymelliopsis sp. IMI 364377]